MDFIRIQLQAVQIRARAGLPPSLLVEVLEIVMILTQRYGKVLNYILIRMVMAMMIITEHTLPVMAQVYLQDFH